MPQTVGRQLVDSLEAHDIDLVYCVPGESYLGFTDALADSNPIRNGMHQYSTSETMRQ